MASIKVSTNIEKIVGKIMSNFEILKDKEYLLRPLAFETIANMKDRIHHKGEASDGQPIGTYSSGYMKARQRANLGEDTKIIVTFTGQLSKDWAVIGTENGYGIGFNNSFNRDKAKWVEENKKKIIFNLSSKEKDYITERIIELVDDALNS